MLLAAERKPFLLFAVSVLLLLLFATVSLSLSRPLLFYSVVFSHFPPEMRRDDAVVTILLSLVVMSHHDTSIQLDVDVEAAPPASTTSRGRDSPFPWQCLCR
jgi:hypothetical protein